MTKTAPTTPAAEALSAALGFRRVVRPTSKQMLKAMAQAADEQRRLSQEFCALQNEEDAGNYRNLLKARTMIALGDKDPIWQLLVDAFEARVKAQVQSVVGGS